MSVLGFSSEKTKYCRSALSFYFIEIFYMESEFITILNFLHFSAYLTLFCSQLTIKCLGSGQKPR